MWGILSELVLGVSQASLFSSLENVTLIVSTTASKDSVPLRAVRVVSIELLLF